MGRKKKQQKIETILDEKDTHIVKEPKRSIYDDTKLKIYLSNGDLYRYGLWFNSKYHINIEKKKFYRVDYDPKDTSNLGCGYTKHIYAICKTEKDLNKYCKDKFGPNVWVECQWGTSKFRKYKKTPMETISFLKEVKQCDWREKYWECLPESKYGTMKLNDRNESVYKPDDYEVISC